VTAPMFVPKSPPDSLIEHGIDAHPDNAIYLEWEEPATADEEGILSYYIYRGTYVDGEYNFKYLDQVIRNSSIVYESDTYVDYDVDMDTTYYYYLRSHNDFADSRETSDTVSYNLAMKAYGLTPSGAITTSTPHLYFAYPRHTIDRISYYYCRLYYLNEGSYEIIYFVKIHRFDFSQSAYYVYLSNNNSHTTVLYDGLWINASHDRYLEKGNYRWRVDAVSGELGGNPETEGSESEWVYFTVN